MEGSTVAPAARTTELFELFHGNDPRTTTMAYAHARHAHHTRRPATMTELFELFQIDDLLTAARRGDKHEMLEILASETRLRHKHDALGNSALHAAAVNALPEGVRWLFILNAEAEAERAVDFLLAANAEAEAILARKTGGKDEASSFLDYVDGRKGGKDEASSFLNYVDGRKGEASSFLDYVDGKKPSTKRQPKDVLWYRTGPKVENSIPWGDTSRIAHSTWGDTESRESRDEEPSHNYVSDGREIPRGTGYQVNDDSTTTLRRVRRQADDRQKYDDSLEEYYDWCLHHGYHGHGPEAMVNKGPPLKYLEALGDPPYGAGWRPHDDAPDRPLVRYAGNAPPLPPFGNAYAIELQAATIAADGRRALSRPKKKA